jgi:hypothetical protein
MTTPIAVFKGDGVGGSIDMSRSSLTPLFLTYVKAGRLTASPGAGSSTAGFSASKIACRS